ncbi:hypothetical protein RHMOL_Rhmol13G0006400 [Rhododendron molle]|uniref:Uncharacterized protein n=1 Tax=Rhododendron molle TaxID=49168 RepID=A0ACC0L2L7_RHOML|nr:hypothetical protein RHMOL_Rhmol13G0006400 [Rhododendron molle]
MGFEMNAALTEKGAAAEFVKPGSIQYPRRKFSAPPAVRQSIRCGHSSSVKFLLEYF